MSPALTRKLLILAVGVLLILIGVLYQLRQNTNPVQNSPSQNQPQIRDILTNSLLQQRRHFQRCWLRKSDSLTEENKQITWQIFLKIQSNGKVSDFSLLNKNMFDSDTEKCLREIAYRLKFPSFSGEEISLAVPVVISNTNENH